MILERSSPKSPKPEEKKSPPPKKEPAQSGLGQRPGASKPRPDQERIQVYGQG